MEGAPGKVKVMETHHGGRATTRGNNGGVHWRLTAAGRLRRPATSSVRPCSMRPMRGGEWWLDLKKGGMRSQAHWMKRLTVASTSTPMMVAALQSVGADMR
jgi:hypothetical protein